MRVCAGLLAAILFLSPVCAEEAQPAAAGTGASAQHAAPSTKHAGIASWNAPEAVKKMAHWVLDSGDNSGMPFAILDKSEAKVFVFDKSGKILGIAWVLVGMARGDDSVPGIGSMPLGKITPDMRTTPAGRFVAAIGRNLGKLDVLWVDYPSALSLHRVINTNPAEQRLERIASAVAAEHRISYGCINVPAKFFDSVVDPTFRDTNGIVYILPEVKEMRAVFPAYYDVDQPEKVQAAINGSVDDHDLARIVHRPGFESTEKALPQ
jgi:hypothetical protein